MSFNEIIIIVPTNLLLREVVSNQRYAYLLSPSLVRFLLSRQPALVHLLPLYPLCTLTYPGSYHAQAMLEMQGIDLAPSISNTKTEKGK